MEEERLRLCSRASRLATACDAGAEPGRCLWGPVAMDAGCCVGPSAGAADDACLGLRNWPFSLSSTLFHSLPPFPSPSPPPSSSSPERSAWAREGADPAPQLSTPWQDALRTLSIRAQRQRHRTWRPIWKCPDPLRPRSHLHPELSALAEASGWPRGHAPQKETSYQRPS